VSESSLLSVVGRMASNTFAHAWSLTHSLTVLTSLPTVTSFVTPSLRRVFVGWFVGWSVCCWELLLLLGVVVVVVVVVLW